MANRGIYDSNQEASLRELAAMTELELLQTHSAVIAELRSRGVVKTNNNPVGDYTEWLVCHRLGLKPEGNSRAAFDAIDTKGTKYQIKGRLSNDNSVQFSTIRNLEQQGFDFVIAVIFDRDFSVRLAVKIAHSSIPRLARYQGHVNGHNLILTENAIQQDGVQDITHLLS